MRIAIVNDVPLAVEGIRRALSRRPDLQIAWVAGNGAESVEKCRLDTPDLVLMDLIMPVMGGVEATRHIMVNSPCAVLIVTGDVGANASLVFEAMGAGALDAVDTPMWEVGQRELRIAPLIQKIDAIERLLRDRSDQLKSDARVAGAEDALPETLVAIGASAGGPAALAAVLSSLPRDFPAAIVIVQHVDARFAPSMVEWLSMQCKVPLRLAAQGDQPRAGLVLLAGTNDHLRMSAADSLGYSEEPKTEVYRPSVDVFFQSVCRHWPGRVIGVLLSGMGRDGAKGLKALRDKGHYTIAQDEASCAVFGMPKAAIELGAACAVLPASQIGDRLAERASA